MAIDKKGRERLMGEAGQALSSSADWILFCGGMRNGVIHLCFSLFVCFGFAFFLSGRNACSIKYIT